MDQVENTERSRPLDIHLQLWVAIEGRNPIISSVSWRNISKHPRRERNMPKRGAQRDLEGWKQCASPGRRKSTEVCGRKRFVSSRRCSLQACQFRPPWIGMLHLRLNSNKTLKVVKVYILPLPEVTMRLKKKVLRRVIRSRWVTAVPNMEAEGKPERKTVASTAFWWVKCQWW